MASTKYKKGKDGYFQARVWDGTWKDGKKHRITLRTKKSSRELERMVNEFTADVESRKHIRHTDVTFLQYARSWKEVYKMQREGNTQAMYENIIEKHFVRLDGIALQDVDRIHLQQLLNSADGHPRTQQQIYQTFRQVLQSAVADHVFPANIFGDILRNIDTVKYAPGEKRPLTENERICLFKAVLDLSDKVFVYILYGCGLRRGEALALTIFDINLRKRELTVNKSHELIKGSVRQKPPKTENGYRTVPIPERVFPAVEEYVSQLRASGKTYLFTMRDGRPTTKSSYDKMWRRIRRALQDVSDEPITGLTAHIFRHNYCTMLCYQIPAISIKRIAQLLGDTERMVLEVYNHIVLEREDAEAAVNNAMNF